MEIYGDIGRYRVRAEAAHAREARLRLGEQLGAWLGLGLGFRLGLGLGLGSGLG